MSFGFVRKTLRQPGRKFPRDHFAAKTFQPRMPLAPIVVERFTKQQEPTMPFDNIAKSAAARASGRLTDAEFSKRMEIAALEAYPDSPNTGVAMSKWLTTAIGKQCLKVATSKSYEEGQARGAVGDGAEVVKRANRERKEPFALENDNDGKTMHRGIGEGHTGEAKTAADHCHKLALDYSRANKISLSESYDSLMKLKSFRELFGHAKSAATSPVDE